VSPFDSNRVQQNDIKAGRNVAGRDLVDNSVSHHYYKAPLIYREDKQLRALVEEHEKEKLLNREYKEFSDRLNSFLNKKVNGALRTLNEKLISGNREYLVEFAMDLKESVTKKILRNSHFESAQKIYTYLLAQIRVIFLNEITSKIKSGDFKDYQIDELIVERIIDPLLHSVDGCSLLIDKEELYGLLYILTGNCHIEWD